MTNVLSIDNVATSDTDVGVPLLTQASLVLRSSVTVLATGVTTSVYVMPTGDPNYPMTVTVRTERAPNAKADGQRRSSITLASYARVVDGDGVVLALKPISAVLAFNTPFTDFEASDLSDLLGNLYGLSFGSLNTKVPAVDHLNALLFGVTELY